MKPRERIVTKTETIEVPVKEELDPIIDSVKVAEGYRTYLYIDATGHQTFGYGWNVDNGIDQSLAEAVLNTQLLSLIHISEPTRPY